MATLRFVVSRLLIFTLLVFCSVPLASASGAPGNAPSGACTTISDVPHSSFPAVAKGCDEKVEYIGAYFADGKFRTNSMHTTTQAQELAPVAAGVEPSFRPADVPGYVDLHAYEQKVENLDVRNSLQKSYRARSRFSEWRDDLITFAYGHEQALLAPEYVTTDNSGRVIVADPAAQAIHVLDRKHAFRIVAGPQYRLHHVGAVATDSDGDIYVADAALGIVVEFDRDGRYMRDIGRIGDGEGMFYHPAAIAIDRENQLYVADAGREMVLVLNPSGRVVKRAGGRRMELGVTFHRPSALAVEQERIVVLDSDGTRIQVFDMQFRAVTSFPTTITDARAELDADSLGNLYLSSGSAKICIFDRNGRKKGEFGRSGSGRGDIRAPRGVWIDANDRMYVADKDNRRIDVFQIALADHSTAKGTP